MYVASSFVNTIQEILTGINQAIQGIGGGGMLIVVTVLLSDLIPLRDRGTYQGYLNLIGALGSTSGGPVGA